MSVTKIRPRYQFKMILKRLLRNKTSASSWVRYSDLSLPFVIIRAESVLARVRTEFHDTVRKKFTSFCHEVSKQTSFVVILQGLQTIITSGKLPLLMHMYPFRVHLSSLFTFP